MMNLTDLVKRLEQAELNYEEALRMVPKTKDEKHCKDNDMNYYQGQVDAYEQIFKDIRKGI